MADHIEELRKRGMITSLAKVPVSKTDHIEALRAEVDALREALKELITWIPSADTYRRLGFDPESPMRALRRARAAVLWREE